MLYYMLYNTIQHHNGHTTIGNYIYTKLRYLTVYSPYGIMEGEDRNGGEQPPKNRRIPIMALTRKMLKAMGM